MQQITRGMWIWNTNQVVKEPGHAERLFESAKLAQVNDLYLYVAPTHYEKNNAELRLFNAKATGAGLRVWGLDGARAYFSDADGPQELFSGIDNLLTFNRNAKANERFVGFQADNEPQDHGQYKAFHSGIKDSELSDAPGTGVWQSTQKWDRELLMRDWLHIHQAARRQLHNDGLLFGAAIPSWICNYHGEDLHVSFPTDTSPRKTVMEYMMHLVDDYVVMSYNVKPENAANRALGHAQLASQFPQQQRPRVYASIECTKGNERNVSYGDTPGKDSRLVVLRDMQWISNTLSVYPGFAGMAIHQWRGWEELKP